MNSSSAEITPNDIRYIFMNTLSKDCYNDTGKNHSRILNETEYPSGPKCPRTFDGFSCWDETPASAVAYQKCPSFLVGFDPSRYVYKRCTENGTWYTVHSRTQNSWTNYTTCIDMEDLEFRKVVNDIYVYGYIVSVVALLISIGMFIYYKTLQCTRIRIHMHLFTAFVFNNILWIVWYKMVVNDPDVVKNNEIWCQWLHVVTHYFMVTCYFWMFLEALHLNIALIVVFVQDALALRWFVAIGWGLSFVVVAIYSAVRYYVYEETDQCWMEDSKSFWIITAPVVASLCTSFLFLINVVRVLVTKLFPIPNQDASVALKKATRATLLLIPLFGLHFILIPLRPSAHTFHEKVYQVISALITSLQGLCVSILFCFTNHEVRAATRGHLSRVLCGNNGIPLTGMTGGESLANTLNNNNNNNVENPTN